MNRLRKFLSLCLYIFIMISLSMISAIALVNVIFDIEDSKQSEVVTIVPMITNNIEPDTPHIDASPRYIEAELVYIEEESSEDTTLEENDEEELAIVEVDPEELDMLACTIYVEAGGDACSDETRMMVGNVVLNRVAHPDFPNTIEEVLLQPRQYNTFSWDGIVWPDRASYDDEQEAVQRAYDIARRLLEGERVLDSDVIWQAEFFQGTELVAYQDGMYFCK